MNPVPSSEQSPSRLRDQRGGDLARRTARNSFYALLGFAVPTLITVVTTPIVIHYLGIHDYGILALASVFAGFVGLLDFGMAPTLLKFVAEYIAVDEHERVKKVIGASLAFYALMGSLGAGIAIATGEFLLGPLFHIHSSGVAPARFAFVASGIGLFFGMLFNAMSSLPASVQRFDVSARITILMQTLGAALMIIVLALGSGLRGAAAASAAVPALGVIGFAVVNARIVPGFRAWPSWDVATLRQMFSFSNYAFATNIAGVVLFQVDKVLLGSLSNIASVTFYAVPSNVARRIHAAIANLTAVVLPVSSGLFAVDDRRRIQSLYLRATRFTLLFLVSVSIPLIVFANKILRYWLGGAFPTQSSNVFRVLVLTYDMVALSAIPYWIALGVGRPKVPAAFTAAGAVLNVTLVAAFVPSFGPMGAATGYLISTITIPAFVWYVERKLIDVQGSAWQGMSLRLSVAAAVQAGLCFVLKEVISSVPTLIGALVVSLPAATAVAYIVGFFAAEDKDLILRLVRPAQ